MFSNATKKASAVAIVGVGGIALTVLAAGSATALTPPAPTSHGPASLSNKPLVDSGKYIKTTSQKSGPTTIDLEWEAPAPFALMQTSKQKPVHVKGVWKFKGQPVPPVVVTGTPKVQANIDDLSTGPSVRTFHQHVAGLRERTGYYSIVTLPVGPGYKPVQQAYLTTTTSANLPLSTPKVRKVRMTVNKVEITKDGDTGIRGKGEVRFGVRLAPDANPLLPSEWGTWSHNWDDYTKASDGESVNFSHPLTHTVTTTKSSAFVEVQGYENDIDPGNNCAIEGGADIAKQYSDKCFDAAVAQGSLQLTTKQTGVTTQYVDAKVYRSPALQFRAVVKVESWFV